VEPPIDFTPEFPGQTQARIRAILGPVWERIDSEDRRGREATPPNPTRHPLAAMYESAGQFNLDEVARQYPGRLGDLLGLAAIANILERSRDFEAFPGLVSAMASPKDFRHHMLTLGLADHFRAYTPYRVLLPSPRGLGDRMVDLLIIHEDETEMEVETKTRNELDGPRREVTMASALGAVSRAWRKAVSGDRAQLGRAKPGLLLIGGVSLKLESLDTIQRASEEWLSRRGPTHPNVWGIAAISYWTYTLNPPGRVQPEAGAREVHGRAGVQLRFAKNPHYTGHIEIIPTPYVLEPISD
jgi:hypothetical protein